KLCWIFRPQYDIDLLTAQFVAHRLHARTAHTHTGTNGIDATIMRHYGNLGTHAGIAGCPLKLKQALFNFGHFVLEELTNELGRRTRKDDLLTTGGTINLEHISAHAVTHPQVFTRNHLGTWQTGFDLAN